MAILSCLVVSCRDYFEILLSFGVLVNDSGSQSGVDTQNGRRATGEKSSLALTSEPESEDVRRSEIKMLQAMTHFRINTRLRTHDQV